MIRAAAAMKIEERERMRGGNGRVTVRHYFEAAEFAAPVRLCARLTIPPGAGIGVHEHLTEDEVYVITAGAGLLDDGQSERRVCAGDAILTGRGESHAIRNDGASDLELIAFIATYPPAAPNA